MKVKKVFKLFLLIGIIIITFLIIPSSEAAPLSSDDSTANFYGVRLREGGAESSGTLSEEQQLLYDTNRYAYKVGDKETFKIVEAQDGENFSNEIYCLDARKLLASSASESLEYTNLADMFDSTDINVKSLYLGTDYASDPDTWEANYSMLLWLLNNVYLEKQNPEAKDMFLKGYSDYLNKNGFDYSFETVKAFLTDDDIEVAEQYAIWYFTNGDDVEYGIEELDSVELTTESNDIGSYLDITGDDIRQELISNLYTYLIYSAMESSDYEIVYPSINNQSINTTITEYDYYKAGPFEVSSGDANKNYYDLKLLDQNGNEIDRSEYLIKINDIEVDENIDEIFDRPYYVYIPKTNTDITEITLSLTYRKYETSARVWKTTVASDAEDIESQPQDIVLLTKDSNDVEESQTFEIEQVGRYKIQVIKEDSEDETKLENAKFAIKVGNMPTIQEYTNENGLIEIDNIEISNTFTETIILEEIEAPTEEYKLLNGTLMIEINKAIENNKYNITSINVISPVEGINVEFDKSNQLIKITAKNSKDTVVQSGNYELELIKTDEDGNIITDGIAKFGISVNNGNQTEVLTNLGVGSYGTINISSGTDDTIKITENEAPSGYSKLIDVLNLTVTKGVNNNQYIINGVNLVNENASAVLNGNKITVSVKNEKVQTPIEKTGSYDLEIIKTDESWNKIETGTAKFNVKVNEGTNQEILTNQGTANYGAINITDISTNDTIKITESEAPSGYNKLINEITINVEKEDNGTGYQAKTVSLTGSEKARATLSGNKITVEVQNQKKTGSYDLEIIKTDENWNKIETGEAKFNVKVNEEANQEILTNQGIGNYGTINIQDISTNDTIKITESEAPSGYNKLINEITINVEKEDNGTGYEAKSVSLTGSEKARATLSGNKITVEVQNQKKTGSYDLEIIKTDENWNKIETGEAKFNVKVNEEANQEILTNQGIGNYGTINIQDISTNDTIKIAESEAPSGYNKLINEITINVEKEDNGTGYEAKTVSLTGSEKARATLSGNKITVEVQNQKKTGSYDLEIIKTDENWNKIETGEAKFNVKVNEGTNQEITTNQGTANYGAINITDISTNDTIKITESEAPSGYNKLINEITINVEKEDNGTGYEAKSVSLTGSEKARATLSGNKITVEVQNQKKTGSYDLEIIKTDENWNKIETGEAKFNVKVNEGTNQEITTNQGTANYGAINITDISTNDTIKITESEAPSGYNKLINEITINVEKEDNGTGYEAKTVSLTGSEKARATLSGNKITVEVQNQKKTGSYNLEIIKTDESWNKIESGIAKFNVKVNEGTNQEILTNQGTANYGAINITDISTNDTIKIIESEAPSGYNKLINEITINVEKEDNGTGYQAKTVSLTGSEKARATLTGDKITVEVQNEKKTGSYDLEIIKTDESWNKIESGIAKFNVKVNEEVAQEITTNQGIGNYGAINIQDISTNDTIKITESEAPSGYNKLINEITINIEKEDNGTGYEAKTVSLTGSEKARATLTGDKITVEVQNQKKTGSYNLEIIKTDESWNKIESGIAKFNVKVNSGSVEEVTTNQGIGNYGTINIQDISTNDTIKITESEAPSGYNKLINEITINVEKEDNGTGYEAKSVSLTGSEKARATLSGNKITVEVQNQKKTGSYDLEIIKTDENWNKIETGEAKFNVKVNEEVAQEITTNQGTANYGTINIQDISTNDTIKIAESEAPSGYNKLINEITINVEKEDNGTGYQAKTVSLTGSEKARATLSGNKITVEVQNQKKTGSYDLEIIKTDENWNKIETGEAKFNVKVNEEVAQEITTNQGTANYGTINIQDISTNDTIKIAESEAPSGYNKLINEITINVEKEDNGTGYQAKTVSLTGSEKARATLSGNKITVEVQNQKKTGSYDLEIIKTDENWNKIETGEAKFNVKVNEEANQEILTNQGIGNYGTINIQDISTNDTIKIAESEAPSGYNKLINEITINIEKEDNGTGYQAKTVSLTGSEKARATLSGNKITVEVQNQKKTGSYDLEIIKTDESWNKIESGIAKFNVKVNSGSVEEVTTNQGIGNYGTINITDISTNDTIKIAESKAPSGYNKLINEITINVEKEDNGTGYQAKTVSLTGSEKARATLSGNKITVEVQNQKKTGSYELEIIKVDENGNIIVDSEAKFSVKLNDNEENEVTTNQGIGNYGTINITDISTNDTIKITESEAPSGYNKEAEEVLLSVVKEEAESSYIIKEVILNGSEKATVEVENNKIILKIENEKIKGSYNLEITKVNKKDSEEKIANVLFDIEIGETKTEEIATNENGIINIPNIPITNLNSEKIILSEKNVPEEYELLEEIIEINIEKTMQDGKYVVSNVTSQSSEFYEVKLEDDTIKVIIKNNKKILGFYDLEIIKTDEENNILEGIETQFEINTEEKQTENGIIKYENVKIDKTNAEDNDIYTIKELNTSDDFIKFNGEVRLVISKKLSSDETKYEIKDVMMETVDENGKIIDNSRYASFEIEENDGKQNVKLKIKNYEKLDFSLRKFISAVSKDETFEEEEYLIGEKSRQPQVDLTNLDNGEETTAKYKHTKEELEVSKDSYILYKIRVYNEGNKDGYVTKITDYIPNGLEFVKELNNIWNYDEATNTITTNENYVADLIEKHNIGEELHYQDLDVILKVKQDCDEDINIVNIAKIDKINYKDGSIGLDRDNNNIFSYPEKISSYKGGEDEEQEDDYVPGQEDSDDFEKIVVLDYEHIDLSLRVFISAVSKDNVFEENEYLIGDLSREPIIDLSTLDNRENISLSKTAIYNHTKAPLNVKANDYILYKIRIYNEGNINGLATKIKDYLPDGLEFAEENEKNQIWSYNQDEHSITTNENFEPKMLSRHYKGIELDYQEIEVVCKVKEQAEEDINIVNIAEITEKKDENGAIFADRDNGERFNYPNDISNYNGGSLTVGNYIPGQEDDDDFDRVMIKSLYGEYDIQIIKTDEIGNTISNISTTFSINGEEKETINGMISLNNIGINKKNLKDIERYEIIETKASDKFIKYNGSVTLEISKRLSDDETKYEIDKDNTKLIIKDENGIEAEISNDATIEIENYEGKELIKVKIRNYEKVDLSLRKYVAACSIDSKFDENDYFYREPKIDLTEFDKGNSTTAKYIQSKNNVAVRPNDYILYRIRVYNEGNKPAYASQIKDYLPKQLEFVRGIEQNKIWDYDFETNIITTNNNYVANLIEGHTIGKELNYQELEVVLRVKDDVEENTRIVNVAEITESKFADGLIAVDIDNKNNYIYPSDISKYYGGEDNDKSDNYIPGQEDDDDFDSIIVNTLYGKYTLEIQKTNNDGVILNNLEAIFEINEICEYSKDGKIDISNVEIDKFNVETPDLYKVIELRAPNGYNAIDGTINITVNKRESADRTKYEPYNIVVEVEKTNGEKYNINNTEIKNQNGETKVIIKIPNEEKAKEIVIPNTTGNNLNTKQESTIVYSNNNSGNSTKTSNPNNAITNIKVTNSNNNSTNTKNNSASKDTKTSTPNTGDNVPEVMFNIIYIVIAINIIEIAIERKYRE